MKNPKRNKELVFNKLNDQLIIIDFKSSTQFHQVNEIGARIWELCDGNHNEESIASVILNEFDGNYSEIQHDVIEFLDKLKENELIHY